MKSLVYSIPEMKQRSWIAYLNLLGLPEGLPFVLFCSILGSLLMDEPPFYIIGLSFASNLAIYCLAQVYKHICNAPEDIFSPSKSDPNPISSGLVSLHSSRITLFLALLTSLVVAFLLSRVNIVLTFSSFLLALVLFHPNIRLSNLPILSFNQHHFLYGGIFLLNSAFANQVHPIGIKILFPLLFVLSFYLLYRLEEVRTSSPQNQSSTFWGFLFGLTFLISMGVSFMLLRLLPFWGIALWVLLAAVQLSISYSAQTETGPFQRLYLLNVFEVSGVVSFLVYLVFIFINTYIS